MKLAKSIGRIGLQGRNRSILKNCSTGMTLLELTVVILVLLSLVSILFIGAKAWKGGSDRVLCILNLEIVQKGVRSYANLNEYQAGETVPGLQSQIIGLGRFVEKMPACPSNGSYTTGGDVIPDIGSLYFTCSLATVNDHEPKDYSQW